ncbi:MAG: DMT family transporter [Bradymonadales bacterium]|nr:DMT family transporter [Bradymonadales bacterium]
MGNQKKAYACGMAAVLFWSTVATAFKVALRHLTVIELVLWSSLTSTIALFISLLVSGRVSLLWRQSRVDLLRSAGLGALNPFLYYLVLFAAYSRLPAQQAQPLNYTWPIFLTLLSLPLLRQQIGGRSILAVLISFAGVLVISSRGELAGLRPSDPAGVLLALSSGVIWAFYWILNLRDRRDPVLKLTVNFFWGSVYILVAFLLHSPHRFPTPIGLAAAAYIGLFEMGITFLVWLEALRRSRTTAQVGILVYLTPFVSLVFISLVLEEPILPSTLVGLLLIVGGIVWQQSGELRARRSADR